MAERPRDTGGVVKRIKPISVKVRSVFTMFLKRVCCHTRQIADKVNFDK